jgi:hypothetical protein
VKHDKAVGCLTKDRKPCWRSMPAEHWDDLRTTNPIESACLQRFAQDSAAKGSLSSTTAKLMVFKLIIADISDKSDKSRRAAGFGRLCRVFTAKRPDRSPPENGRRDVFLGPHVIEAAAAGHRRHRVPTPTTKPNPMRPAAGPTAVLYALRAPMTVHSGAAQPPDAPTSGTTATATGGLLAHEP